MIEKIKNALKEIGENCHTDNGLAIFVCFGGVCFFKKTFSSSDECYDFIIKKYNELEKLQNDMKEVSNYYQKNKTLEGCYYISQEYTNLLNKEFELA